MAVELGLGSPNGCSEIVVIQGGVDDGVTVVLEVSRFNAPRDAVPTVEEEDEHGLVH
jgi:hypothetical protein